MENARPLSEKIESSGISASDSGKARSADPAVPRGREKAPSQAPKVTLWHRRLLGRLHVTGVFWYRIHLLGVRILPGFLFGPVILLFVTFFFLILRSVRQAIIHNLEWVLGPPAGGWWGRQRRAFRTIRNHAWCLTETYQSLASGKKIEIETEGEEHWRTVSGSRRGFVLVTAHVGHWEVGSRQVEPERARKLHIVREQEIDTASQEFLQGLLEERVGQNVRIHFSRSDDWALGARLLAALRNGEMVALQGDRPREGARSQRAELFGKPIYLPVGPVALARAAAVPLLPVFILRQGRSRSQVVFREPFEVGRTNDRDADLAQALQKIVDQVEWAIRREPFQWFCFRDLWGRRTYEAG